MTSIQLPESTTLYRADELLLERAQFLANEHCSEGAFDMAAVWTKNSMHRVGFNYLKVPASLRRPEYPHDAGTHAELDLYRHIGLSDRPLTGTIAIAGKKSRNGAQMNNTRPCAYCAALLHECGIRWVVYRENGEIFKNKVALLVSEEL